MQCLDGERHFTQKVCPPVPTACWLYLSEMKLEHRFNNRTNKFLFRDTFLKLVKADKLPYAELTKAA